MATTELQPLVSEMFLGTWVNVTSLVERDNGNGIRISRKPLTWAERIAPTVANWTFKNQDNDLYGRNPNSQYYGLLGRNTQVRHRLMPVQALFDQSTVDSWPNTSYGNFPWTNSGGAAGDYDCNGVVGTHTLTSANVFRTSFITPTRSPLDVTVRVLVSQVATGAPITSWAAIGTDLNNCYFARIAWNTDNSVRLDLRKNIGGVESNLHPDGAAGETVGTYDIGISYYVRLQWHTSGFLRCMAWLSNQNPPTAWTIATRVRDTDILLASITKAGLFSRRETGNTNVDPVAQFDNYEVNEYRFWGEIPSFSPTRDSTGTMKAVPVTAAGLGQRMQAGTRTLSSALTVAMDGLSEDGDIEPVAHWPMEDAAGSTQFGNLREGGAALITGDVAPASYTFNGPFGSTAVPVLNNGGQISGTFPATVLETDGSGGSIWQYQFLAVIPSKLSANTTFLDIGVNDSGGDHVVRFQVQWDNTFKILTLRPFDNTGTQLTGAAIDFGSSPATAAALYDKPAIYGISIYQSTPGGLVAQQFSAFRPGFPSAVGSGSNVIGAGLTTVMMLPQSWRAYGTSVNAGWSFSHAAYYTDPDLFTAANQQGNANAVDGYDGELSGTRMVRLSKQVNIPFELIGDADDTNPCGAQPQGTYFSVMQTTADVDQGVLREGRALFGFEYVTRTALLNQDSQVSFNHGQGSGNGDLESFQVIDDDRTVRNRIVARRTGGAFAVAEITDGPTSIAEPPDGIGIYPEDQSWNVSTDDQLFAFAGWRAHRLGWDEARYPASAIWRERDAIADVPALSTATLAQDIGDRYTITEPPNDLPPDDIKLMTQGYEELLANFEHRITLDGTAAKPYDVWEADGADTRTTDDHTIKTTVDTTATSWDIINNNKGIQLVTDNAQDGWYWMVEGELVQVTDVAPPDISFVGVGTASTGSSGSRTPGLPASVAAGDLVLIFASTRNSGTGTVATPALWDRLWSEGNVAVLARIYDGVWTMPTVTYSGGAANEDTIAQSAAFRGKFYSTDNIHIMTCGCLNPSAQDIVTPGVPINTLPENLVAIYGGWKQDDFTSVAEPGSWQEMQEASSTAGNDASQVWGYRLFTTRPTAGSLQPALVVTGGASAISRGFVMILASDYQTVTVVRSVNGIVKQHFAGAFPKLELVPAPHLGL